MSFAPFVVLLWLYFALRRQVISFILFFCILLYMFVQLNNFLDRLIFILSLLAHSLGLLLVQSTPVGFMMDIVSRRQLGGPIINTHVDRNIILVWCIAIELIAFRIISCRG